MWILKREGDKEKKNNSFSYKINLTTIWLIAKEIYFLAGNLLFNSFSF